MTRPRLLDLFCCAGGAGYGYHLAGFDVVGVDVDPQPNYPFEFHQADAMTFPLDGFDAIHASPPCQDHSTLIFSRGGKAAEHGTGWMLDETVRRLRASGVPWVVENVPGADLPGASTLCGRSFGIAKLKRHRQFLTSFFMLVPPCMCGKGPTIGVYGELSKNDRQVRHSNGNGGTTMRAGVQTARDLLGCPWMDAKELSQAIPPVYTEYIGEQMIRLLPEAAA
jgi:DNA (cytosine-5)-methyltransferase 1